MLIHVQFKVNLFEVIREIYFPEVAQCLLVNNYLKDRAQLLEGPFFFFCSDLYFQIMFSFLFRASNHQIIDKRITRHLLSNVALTLGYLNPVLNNLTRVLFIDHYSLCVYPQKCQFSQLNVTFCVDKHMGCPGGIPL